MVGIIGPENPIIYGNIEIIINGSKVNNEYLKMHLLTKSLIYRHLRMISELKGSVITSQYRTWRR